MKTRSSTARQPFESIGGRERAMRYNALHPPSRARKQAVSSEFCHGLPAVMRRLICPRGVEMERSYGRHFFFNSADQLTITFNG